MHAEARKLVPGMYGGIRSASRTTRKDSWRFVTLGGNIYELHAIAEGDESEEDTTQPELCSEEETSQAVVLADVSSEEETTQAVVLADVSSGEETTQAVVLADVSSGEETTQAVVLADVSSESVERGERVGEVGGKVEKPANLDRAENVLPQKVIEKPDHAENVAPKEAVKKPSFLKRLGQSIKKTFKAIKQRLGSVRRSRNSNNN